MRYDFDTVIDRHDTYAMKWELAKLAPLAASFGMDSSKTRIDADTIPMMTCLLYTSPSPRD